MRCRQGQATRRKLFEVVKLNIYYFRTFKNIRECWRGREIMLCGKELVVNVCMRTEMRLLCIYRLKASHYTLV